MNLTNDQKKAISHDDGNLKIIACAGSGKTTVMSWRIARLVKEGKDRDKIVAFTFTEKAADSLKHKIREQLNIHLKDKSYLGGMYVGTIHAFAFQLLKELDPNYRNFEVLDDKKRIIWISKKYLDIGLNGIKRDKNHYDELNRFWRSADIVRNDRISTEELEKNKKFKTAFDNYNKLLEQNRYIDFTGIISRLVELLEKNRKALKSVREKINYIVVDEYQDINNIQETLIKLIAGDNGNLCVVGDDDQSIFEFQGADVNNIIEFENRYKNVKTIKLEENFRCPKEIIDAARDLIRRNKKRIPKNMTAGKANGSVTTCEKGDVYRLEFPSVNEEVQFIINKINEVLGTEIEEDGTKRGICYGDIAIIVRSRASANRLIEPFKKAKIKFTFRGTGGLFNRAEIDYLRKIFCYFVDEKNYVNSDRYKGKYPTDPPVSLENLKTDFANSGLSHIKWDDISEKLVALKEKVEKTITKEKGPGRRLILQEFYYELLGDLKINESNVGQEVLFDFGRFSKLISEFESVYGWINYKSLKQFVKFVNGYAHGKTDEGGIDDMRNVDSINILTVHQSKGLEFPVVFIPDISTGRFPSQRRNTSTETHVDKLIDLKKLCSGDEGERRLFYVAVTRTRKFLFLTRSDESDTGKKARKSQYYTEFEHEIMIKNNISDPTTRKKVKPSRVPNTNLLPTSFSDLRYYINCPYNYLLQQIMGFTPVINLSYDYGMQVHNILNYLHKMNPDKAPIVSEVENLVESGFVLRYTRGTPYENMKNKAREILSTYVKDHSNDFPLRLETEKQFELILGGALITGQIDLIKKIDPESGDVNEVGILDYKTEKEDDDTKEYNRQQLRLYAIAGGRSLGLNPKVADIHYLTNNFRQPIDVSDEKLADTEKHILKIIKGIKESKFDACPSEKCDKCNVKHVCMHRKRQQ